MSKLASVYYKDKAHKARMIEGVRQEKRHLKSIKAKGTVTHGGLLLNLGEWWLENMGVRDSFREWLLQRRAKK